MLEDDMPGILNWLSSFFIEGNFPTKLFICEYMQDFVILDRYY